MTAVVAVAVVFQSIGGRGCGAEAEAQSYERGSVAWPVESDGQRGARGRSGRRNPPANGPCPSQSHWRADRIFCIRNHSRQWY